METQDRELLLKDLSARIPYGVIVQYKQKTFAPYSEYTVDTKVEIDEMLQHRLKLLDFKPYLRPLSSMTEKEAIEFVSLYGVEDFLKVNVTQECLEIIIDDGLRSTTVMKLWYEDIHLPVECFDFLLRNHFDFRNLIPMGLALPTPDGMYDFK